MRGFWDFVNRVLRTVLFLPEQASTFARRIDSLHYFEIVTMASIALVTMLFGFWCLWKFRRRQGNLRTRRIEAPLFFELGAGGAMLALFLLWGFLSFGQYVDETIPPEDATVVYVTSKQWMWKFASTEGPASAGVLYVPAGRPVKLLLTSRDVIHSFYVPDFRIKRDAVPGRYNTIWFQADQPGVHRILCAELCGTGHSKMRAAVVVLAPETYARWQRGERPNIDLSVLDIEVTPGGMPPGTEAFTDLRVLGEKIATEQGCTGCHSVNAAAPKQAYSGPTWVGLFGSVEPLQSGERVRVDPEYITRSMMDPAEQIVAGYPDVMPSFAGRISPSETAAIIEYMRSLSVPASTPAHGMP